MPRFLIAAALITAGQLASFVSADDSWPRYAHDAALTGRTTLQGDIQTPRVCWSLSLAGTDLEVELLPTAGRHKIDTNSQLSQRTIGPIQAPLHDVDGTGTLRAVAENHETRWAKILPDVKGLQQIRWTQTRTTAKISRLELIAYDQGYDQPRTVWQSEPEDTVFAPLMIVNDIDHDGEPEICIAMHYRVLIYSGITGKKETELRFHTSRSYGWFGLADVDADGKTELVVLSDFQSHFDVLDYDPAKPEAERLRVRWRRDIETNIEERKKWPQIGPRPLVDVTGDNRPEIVVNLFNDTEDGQWHTVVLDAATGQPIVDLPNRYTHGNADLDHDGKAEIFCTATDGTFVPDYGTIEVICLTQNQPQILWQQVNSGFGLANLPTQGKNSATGASQGMRHVLLTQEASFPTFLVLTHDKTTTLSALRFNQEKKPSQLWSAEIAGKFPTILALDNHGNSASALLRLQLPAGSLETISGTNVRPQIVQRQPLVSVPSAPIAVRPHHDGPMCLYVEGAAETLFAIQPPTKSDTQPKILWQQPGRGIGSRTGSLVAVDFDQDGSTEIIAATRTATGAAGLTAYHADGTLYWQHHFHQTPGARPVHNVGALSYWWPGNFSSTEQTDIFVNTRRGLMHSDVGHLLDGKTGQLIWTQEKAIIPDEFQWGFTGVPVAVADFNGNSLDDLVNLYPVCYWIADGATGNLMQGRDLATQEVVPAWAAYGEPIVYDITGNGEKEILLDCPYILALLDSAGKAIWHGKPRSSYPTGKAEDNIGETTQTKHALLDFAGDGQLEFASAGYKDGIRAIDAQTGKILWSLAAPTPTGRKCSAANIDGNKGDELIYVAGNTLVVVTGDLNSGKILWTWQAQAALSLPAITDLDNDGRAEIVVQSADGLLHCIDGPEH